MVVVAILSFTYEGWVIVPLDLFDEPRKEQIRWYNTCLSKVMAKWCEGQIPLYNFLGEHIAMETNPSYLIPSIELF